MAIVVVALFLPEKNVALFLAVAVAIGIVLGGTQALSRSFFSLLIPPGARASTSPSTTPPSGARRGSGPCCSAWSSRSPGLPAGDRGPDHLLRPGRVLPAPRRPGARHPRGGQRAAPEGMTAACDVACGHASCDADRTTPGNEGRRGSGWGKRRDDAARMTGRASAAASHPRGTRKDGGQVAERTLRGARLGGQSFEDERGIEFAARQQVGYLCSRGHLRDHDVGRGRRPGGVGVPALRRRGLSTSGIEPEVKAEKPARTHWDMLLERRSEKELEGHPQGASRAAPRR